MRIIGHIRRCFRDLPEAEDDVEAFHPIIPGEHSLPFPLEAELREQGYSMLPCKPGRFS